MNQYYYTNTIKKIVIALGDMFNDLQVRRLRDDGTVSKEFKVPFTFGPVEKYQWIRKEGEEAKKYYLQLPRLAMTLDGFNYSQSRSTGVNELRYFFDKNTDLDDLDTFFSDVQPTPYDLNFTLYLRTESMDDFSQIVENIIPYFNPALYLRIKEFDFLPIERDLQVRLEGLTPEFLQEQPEDGKREVNGSIQLTVQAWMYRPITNQKIIKEIKTKYATTNSDLVTLPGQYMPIGQTTLNTITSASTLSDAFNTSGFRDLSAVPTDASSYTTSGEFSKFFGGQTTSAYYVTSGGFE